MTERQAHGARLGPVSRAQIRVSVALLQVVLGSTVVGSVAKAQTIAWRPVDRMGIEMPAAEQSAGPVSSPSTTMIGALLGGTAGGVAGLLFAHEACNEDPCNSGAYLLAGIGGAALLGAMGAIIGSQARTPLPARRSAWTGTAIGAAVGATAGVILVAATCGDQSCGAAGYVSVSMIGGGVLGAVGAVIGSRVGRVGQALDASGPSAVPVLGLSATGMLLGVRMRT